MVSIASILLFSGLLLLLLFFDMNILTKRDRIVHKQDKWLCQNRICQWFSPMSNTFLFSYLLLKVSLNNFGLLLPALKKALKYGKEERLKTSGKILVKTGH